MRLERTRRGHKRDGEEEKSYKTRRDKSRHGKLSQVASRLRDERGQKDERVCTRVDQFRPLVDRQLPLEGEEGDRRAARHAYKPYGLVEHEPREENKDVDRKLVREARRRRLVCGQAYERLFQVVAETPVQVLTLKPLHQRDGAEHHDGRDEPQAARRVCRHGTPDAHE